MGKDLYHNQVITALQKDGWQITHDPYEIRVGSVEMYIDLGAEQIIAAEQGDRKIAVEIKSFRLFSTYYAQILSQGAAPFFRQRLWPL